DKSSDSAFYKMVNHLIGNHIADSTLEQDRGFKRLMAQAILNSNIFDERMIDCMSKLCEDSTSRVDIYHCLVGFGLNPDSICEAARFLASYFFYRNQYLLRGSEEIAREYYKKCIDLGCNCYKDFAAVLIRKEGLDGTIKIFAKYAEKASDLPYIYSALGYLYEAKGDTEMAIRYLEKALDLYKTPDDSLTDTIELLKLYVKTRRTDNAKGILAWILKNKPELRRYIMFDPLLEPLLLDRNLLKMVLDEPIIPEDER
ncbi:MAG: tetratricopeptide repeat protein, partial [bacterium]